jgi:hypothetical protein
MKITAQKKRISVIVLLLATLSNYAAPVGPSDPPPPTPPPPPGLPIDGSILVLLAIGIVYGFYLVKKKNLLSRNK